MSDAIIYVVYEVGGREGADRPVAFRTSRQEADDLVAQLDLDYHRIEDVVDPVRREWLSLHKASFPGPVVATRQSPVGTPSRDVLDRMQPRFVKTMQAAFDTALDIGLWDYRASLYHLGAPEYDVWEIGDDPSWNHEKVVKTVPEIE